MSNNKIQFGRPKKTTIKQSELSLTINSLSIEGRGVAKNLGKTVFVEGAVPGEQVTVKVTQRHKRFDEASVINVQTRAAARIDANCQHYQHCGGCQLKHIETSKQLDFKQQAVLSLLEHNAKIIPKLVADPLRSANTHYRRSARIGVNRLSQTNTSIVGFRRKNSNKLLQVSNCNVLPKHLASLFDQLRTTLSLIENAKSITHIEYLQGDTKGALTFRCKATLSRASQLLLIDMLQPFNLIGYLRYDNYLTPLNDMQKIDDTDLSYTVSNITLLFKPGDFLQVNALLNQQMINRAINWLTLDAQDVVLDLFCGLGNFSLPIAREVKALVAVEGSEAMVDRAIGNAAKNHINNCQFHSADLSKRIDGQLWSKQDYNKVILDPPRSGASEIISQLFQYIGSKRDHKATPISHILYVACDPSSLVRDSKLLASFGYKMAKFCVMDMFPDTTHIESMALFLKDDTLSEKRHTKDTLHKARPAKRLIKF